MLKTLSPSALDTIPSLRPLPPRLRLPQLPNIHPRQSLPAILLLARLKPRTRTHRQIPPITRERQRRDTRGVLLILADASLRSGVPQRHDAVAAPGRERAERRMERQRVDRVHDIGALGLGIGLPVALECVLARLRIGAGIEPLDGDAALDAAGGVAVVVGHACHGAGHEFQGGLALLPGLEVFFGGGGGAVGFSVGGEEEGDGVELVDVEEAGGHGDDELGGGDGEGVGLLGEGDLDGFGLGVAEGVDVEGAVPGCGD